ncbi:hypothetical protein [Shivajiella indica]|uniref:Uncharacterized protein n=1 Tax=Shivajiella indica TaxID=872115 RepID=A0ABW5B5Z2_9BACT
MKINFRKLVPTVCAIGMITQLSSCNNEDDKIPCTDQNLAAFQMVLQDEEENLILDEEEFDIESMKLFAIEEEEESEVEFEIKKTSEDIHFLSSMEMSELSLEDGINSFELRLGEETIASFDYDVTSTNASGCLAITYTAKNDSENLETMTSGNTKLYVYNLNSSEE